MQRSLRVGIATLTVVLALVAAGCGGDDNNNPTQPPPSLELNSGTIGPGGHYAHKFTAAGSYPYFCQIHGTSMSGTITVDPASVVGTMAVSIGDNFFAPNATTVDTGATVTWTNNGAINHTVTSH